MASCLAVVVSGASGCTILTNAYRQLHQHEMLDEFMVSHRNRVMAARAWHRQKHCFKGHHHLDEVKAGFIKGYMGVAEGGDGCLPAIAPREYWGWEYQSAQGQRAVNAWFAGYPHGAKAAEQAGIGHWSQIRPTGMPSPPGVGAPAVTGGEVEMVPTPFMEQDNTLPAPPDPSSASGSVLDGANATNSESSAEPPAGPLPQGGANGSGGAPQPYSAARPSGLLESNDTASVTANFSDEPTGAVGQDAEPGAGEAASEFIETFGQPARSAQAAPANPNGEIPFTFD